MDPYLQGYEAYKAGDEREVPYRFARRSYDGADVVWLQGFDDALADGVRRRHFQAPTELSEEEKLASSRAAKREWARQKKRKQLGLPVSK